MIRYILNKIGLFNLLSSRRLRNRVRRERKWEERLVVQNFQPDKFTELTSDEKKQVDNLWGQLVSLESYREFEFFKHINGFDSRVLTHGVYLPVVARLLNDYRYTKIFEDKGLLGCLKPTSMRFPRCHVRRIANDYYDDSMRQQSLDKAVECCSAIDELFIKPSRETSGGAGSKLLRLKGKDQDARKRIILREFQTRKADFVVQECLKQHPVMEQFNSTSINTLRITTLMLNGKYSLCSIILRFGKSGAYVDNWGAGGIVVPLRPDGHLHDTGYDLHANKYTSNGECLFAGCIIPQVPEILRLVEKSHTEDFSICKFIGWDIAIDECGEPVIIELNSSQPGVIGEQIVSGPIFGNRTQEVIDYCKTKKFSYND